MTVNGSFTVMVNSQVLSFHENVKTTSQFVGVDQF